MEASEDSARAVAAIARIDAVPTLLKVLCEIDRHAGCRGRAGHG